jgi:two-component system chemotaxis sensor kinase CheA
METAPIQDQEIISEFLVESYENLSRLDQELVEIEKHPKDAALLASIFRTIHTVKGTCGFLGFSTLEKITHQAETLLSQLRDGQRELNPSLISLILETVDATRKVLASIEATGKEGGDLFGDLTERLRLKAQSPAASADPSGPDVTAGATAQPLEVHAASALADDRKSEEEAVKPSAVADANIRVGVGLLDKLMDLVGELVLTRNQILQFNTEREDPALNATSQQLNLITSELQEGVMKTRMQPIAMVWNQLPRVVRDMAVSLGKQIGLEMDGADTELDRTVIEAIKDPMVHLVRNSCDHGIELPDVRARAGKPPQGKLTLRALHEGGQVNIEISDDGAGIDIARVKQKAIERGILNPERAEKMSDREVLNLIFLPGFSMAKAVTNLSGRGVGMDVVKSHIEKIGGVVDLFSRPGEGTTVKIKIPLTLAIIPGLVITSGGERFVVPQVSLLELIRLEGDSSEKRIEHIQGTPVYRRRGSLLPVAYLNQVLGLKSAGSAEALSMVVLQAEDRQFGLVVDGINDTQEIVVKPLGKQLKGLSVYAGATIMGDGRVALILDVLGIGQRSGVLAESHHEASRAATQQKTQEGIEQQRLLLLRAGSFERLAVPLSLVARLEEFPQSAIEHAGGGDVVQYRNRILPLVSLRAVLEPGAEEPGAAPDPVQVVVLNDGDRSVGMIVDQILDIAEEAVTVRQKSSRKGLLGSGVIGKRVTDFLDLNQVIQATESWGQGTGGIGNDKKILVADDSAFSRGLIRAGLDMAGYQVVEAGNLDEAIRQLERQPLNAVVAGLDLPPNGTAALLSAMHRRSEWKDIPVLALTDSTERMQAPEVRRAGFQDCQPKFDRVAMLESLDRLASALASPAVESLPVGEKR